MTDIDVQLENESRDCFEFSVIITEGKDRTRHKVSLGHGAYTRLTSGFITPELLVKKSFEFLLERESKESILSQFNLSVIGKYFPEYETEIRARIHK